MANMANTQRTTFEARLKRIDKGGPNTAGTVIVGPQDDPKAAKRRARKYRRTENRLFARLLVAFGHLLLLPVSFLLGGLAMFTGIVAAFHIGRTGAVATGEDVLTATLVSNLDLLLGLLLAIVFGYLFRLMIGPRKIGLAVGVAAAFLLQDSIMQSYPDVFARLMSDEITLNAALAALQPN